MITLLKRDYVESDKLSGSARAMMFAALDRSLQRMRKVDGVVAVMVSGKYDASVDDVIRADTIRPISYVVCVNLKTNETIRRVKQDLTDVLDFCQTAPFLLEVQTKFWLERKGPIHAPEGV